MSKLLVMFYNNTNETIKFVNKEDTGNNQTLNPNQLFTTANHFNIPDNSNSREYFDKHHMEVQDSKSNPIFSFWDDDDDKYRIKYCKGINWNIEEFMPGYNEKGDNINVGIVLTGSSATGYQITSINALANV